MKKKISFGKSLIFSKTQKGIFLLLIILSQQVFADLIAPSLCSEERFLLYESGGMGYEKLSRESCDHIKKIEIDFFLHSVIKKGYGFDVVGSKELWVILGENNGITITRDEELKKETYHYFSKYLKNNYQYELPSEVEKWKFPEIGTRKIRVDLMTFPVLTTGEVLSFVSIRVIPCSACTKSIGLSAYEPIFFSFMYSGREDLIKKYKASLQDCFSDSRNINKIFMHEAKNDD